MSQINFQKKNILDVVEQFKAAEIYLSQDSVGAVAEYLRTGMKWNAWFENFEFLLKNKSKKVRLVIGCTLTLPGILFIEDFLDTFGRYDIEL